MSPIVDKILKTGILKGSSEILSESDIKELENLILKKTNSKNGKISHNIIGIDKRIDELLEKILKNEEIQDTLIKILGKNYLLRHVTARYNEPQDRGLAIHQDAVGEFGIMILLNEQTNGSTFFFPGTHLIPMGNYKAEKVSWGSLKLINLTKWFLMLAKGKAGNYYYFLHRTWHGRMPGQSKKTNISLFFDFFPVSAKRKDLSQGEYIHNSNIKCNKITEKNLKKIVSKENYNNAVATYEKEINITNSLSMEANSYNQILKNKFFFVATFLKLISLEIFFLPITLKRLIKSLKK
ncbi:hypothetical protein [Candidatus Pelagibacter sp. HIMB1587]|uniref:hypothetical protein n=1 Tax=Candidatus Pelagibacter sp. HIMB1587 TaxID=3413354 RepID=UPI003F87ABB9